MTRSQILAYIATLDGWLSLHEGFFLYEIAKNGKGKGGIVEIGSWKGKSTVCLAAGSKLSHSSKVTAIDPHKGEFTQNNKIGKKSPTFKIFQDNISAVRLLSWVKPILATSEKAARSWKKQIRLLFIDGLHDYKNTQLDYSLWLPFVRRNGVIAFHDAFCGHIGPERVILEEVLPKKWKDIGVVGSIIYVKRGSPKTFWQKCNLFRHRFFIPVAIFLNRSQLPHVVKFFLIHRVIKMFLLNPYTFLLQLNKA